MKVTERSCLQFWHGQPWRGKTTRAGSPNLRLAPRINLGPAGEGRLRGSWNNNDRHRVLLTYCFIWTNNRLRSISRRTSTTRLYREVRQTQPGRNPNCALPKLIDVVAPHLIRADLNVKPRHIISIPASTPVLRVGKQIARTNHKNREAPDVQKSLIVLLHWADFV